MSDLDTMQETALFIVGLALVAVFSCAGLAMVLELFGVLYE